MIFLLLPEIKVTKQEYAEGFSSALRHKELGDLGKIRLTDFNGETQISCEVAGDAADPMTATRQSILEPLTREIVDHMVKLKGDAGISAPPAPPFPAIKKVVESKELQCLQCDEFVAMLIYAEDADGPGGLEDYARMMYQKMVALDLPTWVIGPQEKVGPDGPADILKVWPEREPICRMKPDEFNPIVEKLQESHCAGGGERAGKNRAKDKATRGNPDMHPKQKAKIAVDIHEFVKKIKEGGGTEKEIITSPKIIRQMEKFKILMDNSSQEEMDNLAAKYDGFYEFAILMESFALAIEEGDIKVPPR